MQDLAEKRGVSKVDRSLQNLKSEQLRLIQEQIYRS